jgi:hypothetical protein
MKLELIEKGVEALEIGCPDAAVLLEPFGGFCKGLGFKVAGASLGVAAARD